MSQPVDRKKMTYIGIVALAMVIAIASLLVMRSEAEGSSSQGSDPAASDSAGKKNAAAAPAAAGKDSKNGKNGEKEKVPVPVSVMASAVGPISAYISSTANLVAENEVEVLSEAEGRVASLLVEEGVSVRKGEPLVQLVRGDAEMVAAKARVRASNARVAHARASEMFTKGLVSQGDYEKAAMEREVADQELAEAQWRLSKTTVRAPFDGVITRRAVSPGKHVRPGEALFTVTDFDPLIARIYLAEKDVMGLREGQTVRLTMRAGEGTSFPARIRQISPVVDTATGTVKLTVEAGEYPSNVRPGAFVSVDIVQQTRPSALVVPKEAVLRELQESHVFVALDGTAKKRTVTLGLEEGDRVEILTGLRAGESVIVAGQGGLKDGSPVRVLDAPVKVASR
ncbi:MAG: efflux RND transporter periplasmic adaptor subunit [Thermoanaerobaculia bacterium]